MVKLATLTVFKSGRGPEQDGSWAAKRKSSIEHLIREPSAPAQRKASSLAPRVITFESEIRDIANRDYRAALRRSLSRPQVHRIVSIARSRVWPHLNREPVRLVSLAEFVHRWSTFGVDFKFASLPSKTGLSLLGFYLTNADGLRERPLIFANTAHHPALVGVALDHEMGHHLTAQIFGSADESTHLLSLTAFEEHMIDPVELAADALVSFGIFPAPVARALFHGSKGAAEETGLPDVIFAKVLTYIRERYGFRFGQINETRQKFQALAALVHYTKLRRALLDEYGA
jgi:hypothetical protein